MSALTKGQKAAVAQLMSLTSVTEKQALELLRPRDWNVERAADYYYDHGAPAGATTVPSTAGARVSGGDGRTGAGGSGRVEPEWLRLRDPSDPDRMNLEQIEAFAGELGIDPFSDPVMLYIAYNMGCKEQGVFTHDEFVAGMTKMAVDTAAALKARLPTLRKDMNSAAVFPRFYTWCYDYNCDPGQKSLKLEVVLALTPMLITPTTWPLVPDWIAFLSAQKRTVTKDCWAMLLDFQRRVKPDLSNYDEDTAWPVLIDEFVEHQRKAGKAAVAGGAGR